MALGQSHMKAGFKEMLAVPVSGRQLAGFEKVLAVPVSGTSAVSPNAIVLLMALTDLTPG